MMSRRRLRTLRLFVLLALGLAGAYAGACRSSGVQSTMVPDAFADLHRRVAVRLERFLIRDPALGDHFALRADGFALYASAADKAAHRPECLLYWEEWEAFARLVASLPAEEALQVYFDKRRDRLPPDLLHRLPPPSAPFQPGLDSDHPLRGLRVALDPGHLGGSMAMAVLEKRAVQMHPDPTAGLEDGIAFNEGNLTLATATVLAEKLRAAGATVLLTRERPGHGAFGMTYEAWKARHFESALDEHARAFQLDEEARRWWREEADEETIFARLYGPADRRERARRINAFQPHLTLILHFNVEESNWPEGRRFAPPVPHNFNLAFIPGAYVAGELSTVERRFELLARLVSDELERSLAFSAQVVAALVRHTGAPALDRPRGQRYLLHASMATEVPGVWARNLTLTRKVRGALSYGESLFQDSIQEVAALNRKDVHIAGIDTSPRVLDIAAAYYEAIVAYALGNGD